MTAYVPKGSEPNVTFITTDVDTPLTNWATKLAAEYSSSPVVGAKLLYVASAPRSFVYEPDWLTRVVL